MISTNYKQGFVIFFNEFLNYQWYEKKFTVKNTFRLFVFTQGLIEHRGGGPLLDMLPDVFEWPIAVDEWETNYGKVFFSTVRVSRVMCRQFALSHFSELLTSSGKSWRLEDVIAKLNEKYGTQLLVNFFVGSDDKDSNSHIIHVGVQL